MDKKKERLEIFDYSSGEARKLLEIFKKMYFADYVRKKKKAKELEKKAAEDEDIKEELENMKYWRHWVLWGIENSIVFFQAIPGTKLNEFILRNPTTVDLELITGFCATYRLDFLEVPRVDFKKENNIF
ncbi:MAG TPA: hypothetical protein ENH90_00060 [bacterium]|nr:hypothetical protein [bacterium]